ncbi:MAG: ABC transporter substrate-binding protein [Gulosibacter sp.]|uniref:ABC transporter substrate-binding protein n=1 Tax=Gulosibacter sp. TaxID=2817531 RepID=UPI003F91EB64
MHVFQKLARGRVRQGMALGVSFGLAVALAGCSTADSPASTEGEASADLGTCGQIPDLGFDDQSGVLAELGDLADYYNGFPVPVLESAWADWVPDHDGPFTAGVITNPLSNPFQTNLHDGLIEGLESAGIEVIADLAAPDQVDVGAQSQQFQQVLSQSPDIIFFGPLAAEPAIELVNQAGEAGIPVVSLHQSTNSPYAVSVVFNNVLEAMTAGAGVATSMGGEGTVLRVHGVQGIAQDNEAGVGYSAVLDNCPGIEQVSEVNGMYQTAPTQQAVVQFLSTNPAGVDGVLSSGAMGLGIIQGFEQGGHTLSAMADPGSSVGSLTFAKENPDLAFFGTAQPGFAMGETMADVGERILAGEGPKINQFAITLPSINQDTIDSFYVDGSEVTDPSGVEGDPNAYFPDEHLDQLFNNPGGE